MTKFYTQMYLKLTQDTYTWIGRNQGNVVVMWGAHEWEYIKLRMYRKSNDRAKI